MLKKSPFFIHLLGFLLFIVISCREKSFEEYNENEFYKAQGVIVSAIMTSSILDDPFMKKIEFEYFINDSLILKNSEDLSFMDLEKGIPIVVLVHKENQTVSFYWRNGFTDSITPFQVQYVKAKMDKAVSEIEKDMNNK